MSSPLRSTSPAAVGTHEGHGCHACEQTHGVELIAWCSSCDEPVCTFCYVEVHVTEHTSLLCPGCASEDVEP